MRIAIVAPSTPFDRADADRVDAIAAGFGGIRLLWHPQCFAHDGHFAGNDALRCAAFVEMANRDDVDALWFARGGYGAFRIAADAVAQLGPAAHRKLFLGYSDGGNLLAALYRARIGQPVHAPMAADIRRDGGERAIARVLGWLAGADAAALEPQLAPGVPRVAFNLITLSMIVGTPIMPDLEGHVLMIEEVSEYLYAFDRALAHVTTALAHAGLAGIRLGRVSDVPENDRPFGETAAEIAQRWCKRCGIAFLGEADIGHDIDNKIVPFGAMG